MPSVQVASNLPLSVELIVVSIAESLLYDKPDRVDMDRVLRGLGLDASSNKQSETPLPATKYDGTRGLSLSCLNLRM